MQAVAVEPGDVLDDGQLDLGAGGPGAIGDQSTTAADRLKAEYPDHVWALDFQHDATNGGRELKFLNIVDEFTREALAIEVDRTINAEATVKVLERLAAERGAPSSIRADNGPEMTAAVLRGAMGSGFTANDRRAAFSSP